MRLRYKLAIALLLVCDTAMAGEAGPKPWSFGPSAYIYMLPDERDYVQPTLTADRDRLHLEARYNYEDLRTASTWIGWNLTTGDSTALAFTPIVGGVFGDTQGIATGYRGSLSWRKLELYSESEWVFDANNSFASFFYSWSQLTLAPGGGSEFGVVMQRNRVYDSGREVQPGLLVGFSHRSVDLSAIVFNPDTDKPVIVVSLALAL